MDIIRQVMMHVFLSLWGAKGSSMYSGYVNTSDKLLCIRALKWCHCGKPSVKAVHTPDLAPETWAVRRTASYGSQAASAVREGLPAIGREGMTLAVTKSRILGSSKRIDRCMPWQPRCNVRVCR